MNESKSKRTSIKESMQANKRPDDANVVALELQREQANNASKQATPKTTSKTVIVPVESSAKIVALLIERIAGKSAVQATDEDRTISITSDFYVTLNIDHGFDVSSKETSEFTVLRTVKSRRIVRVNIALDELAARLPAKTSSPRSTGVSFEYVESAFDMWNYAYPANSEVLNKLTRLQFDKTNRIPSCIINGIEYVGITRTRKETYPSRFDSNGKYIPARVTKDKVTGKIVESDDNPTREIFVIVIPFEDGSCAVLRDQGMTNLRAKIMRLQDSPVIVPTTAHNPADLYVWTPPVKKDDASVNDDDDDDNDDE